MNINDLTKICDTNLENLVSNKIDRLHAKDVFMGIGKKMQIELGRLKYHEFQGIKDKIEFFHP